MNDTQHSAARRGPSWGLGIPIVVAAAGAGVLLWLTAPTPESRPSEPKKPLVTVETLERVDHRVTVQAHGRVRPVASLALVPQVAGPIVRLHERFVPGGRVPAGEAIAVVDPREYEAAVDAARAALETAEEELNLEKGRQRAAEAEWESYGAAERAADQERDLATRGPQLRMREAAVRRAQAALRQAELSLERTRVSFPHPVIIATVDAAEGTVAAPGQPLGAAYPTRALWIDAALPAEKLRWFSAGEDQEVEIWPRGAESPHTGFIREIRPDVQPRGSLGRLLVQLDVPDAGRLPARVGEMVRLTLEGERLEGVFVVPRRAVHGDHEVWLMDEESRLVIQPVVPVFAAERYVVLDEPLEAGQRLITSQLARPVNGMTVRVADEDGAS